MMLRGRFGFWLVMAVLVAVLLFVVPVASKTSFTDYMDEWFGKYNDAVESAQENDEETTGDDEDEEPIGKMMVRIDDEIGEYAGVEVHTLLKTNYFPESKALAKVVDLRPMLALRARYNQALASLNVAKVMKVSAVQELTRLKQLSKDAGSVAAKKVNYAQTKVNEAHAKLQGVSFNVQAVHDEALQTWGETVSSWILEKDSKEWQRLLSHQDSLLLVTLPADISLAAEVSFIRIARDGSRQQARKAYFVSPALITDKVIQGETYFFKTATGKLRSGMSLDAWVPKGSKSLEGVFISEQAIVWSDGQAWAYVQVDDEMYQRRSLLSGLAAAGGVFIQDEMLAGDKLVMRGAQMLLSEEFKWQIADEDDD